MIEVLLGLLQAGKLRLLDGRKAGSVDPSRPAPGEAVGPQPCRGLPFIQLAPGLYWGGGLGLLLGGAVLGNLQTRYSFATANIISSVMFVILHIPGWLFMWELRLLGQCPSSW